MNYLRIRDRSQRELSARYAQTAPVAAINGFLTALVRKADAVFGRRYSLLLITATAILLALLTRFPHYDALPWLRLDVPNQALSWQVRHPLTPIPANLKSIRLYGAFGSHVDKMELRLTLPLLGYLSGTGAWTIVVWNPIAAALLFYLLALCARDALEDTTAAAFFVIGLGATFFGAWGFNDFFFGDAVAFAFTLLSVCLLRRPWLSGLCFLGAAFCDERSVAAAPLLLLYFMVRCSQPEEKARRNQLLFAIGGFLAAWLVLRWWLSATFHLSTGTSMLATWDVFRAHVTHRQTYLSLVGLFRASWIIPVLAVRSLILKKDWLLAASLIVAFGIAAIPALLVVDFNRSLCYVFVIFLISLRLLWHDAEAPKKFLVVIMLVNILVSPPSKTILRLLGGLFANPHAAAVAGILEDHASRVKAGLRSGHGEAIGARQHCSDFVGVYSTGPEHEPPGASGVSPGELLRPLGVLLRKFPEQQGPATYEVAAQWRLPLGPIAVSRSLWEALGLQT